VTALHCAIDSFGQSLVDKADSRGFNPDSAVEGEAKSEAQAFRRERTTGFASA